MDSVEVLPAVHAIESIERAQIDVQIATAKRYPRNLKEVKDGILSLATLDQETAAACFYNLPRGGKDIKGPSVRLAEIAISQYGNVRAQTRIIDVAAGGESPHVTVQSVCSDLEKNVAVSIEKRRRIVGKKSKGGQIDEDDINLAANACGAIAFRDAVFKVVPQVLIKPAFDAARKVAIGDAKTLAARRAACVESFGKMGVPAKRVLASVGRTSIDFVTLDDLETLVGVFTAIREGEVTIEAAFPEPAPVATAEAGSPPTDVAQTESGQGRLPRLSTGKSGGDPKPVATQAPEPKQEPKAQPEAKAETVYPEAAQEPENDGQEPKEAQPAEEERPEPGPAVHGGVTGATRPLGSAGTKKRTLANPGA